VLKGSKPDLAMEFAELRETGVENRGELKDTISEVEKDLERIFVEDVSNVSHGCSTENIFLRD
jgi:hypothetical protein